MRKQVIALAVDVVATIAFTALGAAVDWHVRNHLDEKRGGGKKKKKGKKRA